MSRRTTSTASPRSAAPTAAPAGLLLESAQSLVRDLVYSYPLEDIAGAIDRATRHYLTEGITSAQHRRGSLGPGKLADLAVLSGDPTAVDPEAIAGLQVVSTVVGGEVRHDAGLG